MAEPAAGAASSGQQDGGPPATRASWWSISRQDIADAAVWIVEAGGYEEMSTRSPADGLGVAPMRPALPTPMAATVHRLAGHRETVPQPRLGTDVSLAGRPR